MTTVGLRLAASAASAARGGGSGGEGGPGRVGGRSVLVGDAAHTVSHVTSMFGFRVELKSGWVWLMLFRNHTVVVGGSGAGPACGDGGGWRWCCCYLCYNDAFCCT